MLFCSVNHFCGKHCAFFLKDKEYDCYNGMKTVKNLFPNLNHIARGIYKTVSL